MGEYQNQNTNQQSRAISSQVSSTKATTERKSSAALPLIDNRLESIRFNQLQEAADTFTKKNLPLPVQLMRKGKIDDVNEEKKKIVDPGRPEPTEEEKNKAAESVRNEIEMAKNAPLIKGQQQHNSSPDAFHQRVQRENQHAQERSQAAQSGKKQSETDKVVQSGHQHFFTKEHQDKIKIKAENIAKGRYYRLIGENQKIQNEITQLKTKK